MKVKSYNLEVDAPTVQHDSTSIALTGNMKEIITVREIRRNFIIIALVFSFGCFCFFCINFQMKNVEGEMFYNVMANQSSEIVANFVSSILYLAVGPRKSLVHQARHTAQKLTQSTEGPPT